MRGYGGTDAPQDIGAYTINHLVGDVVAVVNSFGADTAVVVGHDWGAPVAWYSALMRPDMFAGVAALSVPWTPPIGALPEGVDMNGLMTQAAGKDRDYYRLFFQEPGRAEADLEADVTRTMRSVMYTISGNAVADGHLEQSWDGFFPAVESMSQQFIIPDELPTLLLYGRVHRPHRRQHPPGHRALSLIATESTSPRNPRRSWALAPTGTPR